MGRSTDGKRSKKKNEDRFAWPFTFYDIKALGSDSAWVVGYDGFLMRTKNGGMTWDEIETGVSVS